MKTRKEAELNIFILNNDIFIIMSDADDNDSDDHDSHEDQLWNKKSFKKYVLNTLNMLKFSYFISSKISSVLLIIIIY